MRPLWLALAGLTLATAAWGQTTPIQANPLPPIQKQWQEEGSPPVPRAPVLPDVSGSGSQNQDKDQDQVPSVTPPETVQRPNVWIPAGVAKLEALDKVDALATPLTIRVGQSATFGSLTITVKACMVRPIDQPADATAYLDVTDSHPDSPGFNGWMLEHEPSLSMMQNPIYDLRVTGCA